MKQSHKALAVSSLLALSLAVIPAAREQPVRIDGTVRSPEGMLAVVSNPDQRVYFLREGDRLYDGDVEKIGLDGVTFKENSKDAFGKPVERLVTKRIYPSAGEQQ